MMRGIMMGNITGNIKRVIIIGRNRLLAGSLISLISDQREGRNPGPAIIFIPLGLSILAKEFDWAKRRMREVIGASEILVAV